MIRLNRQSGFSLIELIVVLVILGLLAGIVGPAVVDRVWKAKVKTARVQISEFETTLEFFRTDVGRYPTTAEGLEALRQNPAGLASWSGPYLTKALPKDPWNREYVYRSPGQHGSFDLFSLGADGTEGGEGDNTDITSWGEPSEK